MQWLYSSWSALCRITKYGLTKPSQHIFCQTSVMWQKTSIASKNQFIKVTMEKGRRKSSASEFFSRRHSSSLFQSMRRYSTSTVFGLPRLTGASEGKSNGRRHSSTQLPISITDSPDSPGSSRDFTRTERWKSLAKVVLGDVEEQQEVDQSYEGDQGTGTDWPRGFVIKPRTLQSQTFEKLPPSKHL